MLVDLASSAAVKVRFVHRPHAIDNLFGRDAPISAEVMPPSRSTQASAICAKVCPRAAAMSFSACTLATVASVIASRVQAFALRRAAVLRDAA